MKKTNLKDNEKENILVGTDVELDTKAYKS